MAHFGFTRFCLLGYFLILLNGFLLSFFALSSLAHGEDLPELPVRPHLVLDVASEKIISHNLAFERWAPASLTKMMSAYTIFKALDLKHLDMKSPVRVSEEALAQPPSKMGLPIGTILNIETALKIIMVKSANDISVALAQAISGSEEQFVSLMNSHARRLGMTDTHFTNPHGLHDPDQYTSARDMAVLALQLTKEFPQYADFFDIPAIRFGNRRLRNHNALLRLFDGTNGMKTGYVCASGFNVVVRTKRDDRMLIAIVLGGGSGLTRNIRAARLLKEAFDTSVDNAMPFSQFIDVPANSNEPHDITPQLCPYKYSVEVKPDIRPKDAPKANEFDAIDTRIIVPEKDQTTDPVKELASLELKLLPTKRPEFKLFSQVIEEAEAEKVDEADKKQEVPEQLDYASYLKQQAKLYFAPVDNLREDVQLKQGNATGLNPNGIKHTNGEKYLPPIPVPIKRPLLDLNASTE